MRIILILTFIIILGESSFAQTAKGKVVVDGGISMNLHHRLDNKSNYFEEKSFNLSIFPSVGFFVRDNLAFGLDLHYGYSKFELYQRIPNGIESQIRIINSYGGGPFLKYYLFALPNIAVVFDGNIKFLNQSNDSWKLSTEFQTGLSYFLSPKMSLNAQTTLLNYSYSKRRSANDNYLFAGIRLNNSEVGMSLYF